MQKSQDVQRISPAKTPTARSKSCAQNQAMAKTVPQPSIADGNRAAVSLTPPTLNAAARSQNVSGGLLKYGWPLQWSVSHPPLESISLETCACFASSQSVSGARPSL